MGASLGNGAQVAAALDLRYDLKLQAICTLELEDAKRSNIGHHKESSLVKFRIETELDEDGRWIADVIDLPGAMAYGASAEEAITHASALALRILADRIEHGEATAAELALFSVAA